MILNPKIEKSPYRGRRGHPPPTPPPPPPARSLRSLAFVIYFFSVCFFSSIFMPAIKWPIILDLQVVAAQWPGASKKSYWQPKSTKTKLPGFSKRLFSQSHGLNFTRGLKFKVHKRHMLPLHASIIGLSFEYTVHNRAILTYSKIPRYFKLRDFLLRYFQCGHKNAYEIPRVKSPENSRDILQFFYFRE